MESFIEERYENGYYISSWKYNNPLPECLKTITSSEFESLFSLYISLRNTTVDLKQKEDIDKIRAYVEEEYQKKVLQLKKQYEDDISIRDCKSKELQESYTNLREITEKTRVYVEDEYRKKLLQLQKQHEEDISIKDRKISQEIVKSRELQESYNILHKNFSTQQEETQKSINKIQIQHDISIEKEHNLFLTHLENIKSLNSSKDEQISELKQELLHYKNQSLIQQNSSKKGKQGEMKFFNLVNQYTCWLLRDTSGTTDAGDFQGTYNNCKLFIDTKTYNTRGVPKCEIDKFKRNMESNKDIPIGLLIAMESKIVGARHDSIYFEINSNNQLLLYIQNFLSFDHETIFYILNSFIDIAHIIYSRSKNSHTINTELVKPALNSLLKISQETINKISNIKDLWVEKINTDCNELKHNVRQSINLIKEVLQTLFPETNMVIEESEGEKSKPVKRKKKSTTPVVNSNE